MHILFSTFQRSLQRHAAWWAGLYFTGLTVFFTYPLIWRMHDEVVGQIGDNIYFIWLIRWYQQALFVLHTSPFFNSQLNYPAGWSLAATDTVPAVMLYTLPLSWIGGATWAYNAALLLSFILSGWFMYLWLRHLTGSEWAGLLSGTLFAFLPNHMARFLIGHLNQATTQWFPLYFWSLYSLLRAERRAWKPALIAALSLGLISGSTPYYIYTTGIISAAFVAGWMWQARRRLLRPVLWQNLLILGGLALPLVVIPMLPYLVLNQQGGLASRSVAYASGIAASPTDFILPSSDHFLWGAWISAHFDRSLWIETTLYVGAVGGVLALLAWLKRKQIVAADLITPALWAMVVSFVLALGTHLLWLNQKVVLTLPAFLQGLFDRQGITLPLPGYFLFQYLPVYNKMRALARFGFFVPLFVSVLAGLGTAWLLPRQPVRWRTWAAIGLLALVVLDFYPGVYTQFAPIAARPVDAWLAEQPGQGAVAQFPSSQNEDQDQVYNTLVHGKPFIGGFFSANKPAQYAAI